MKTFKEFSDEEWNEWRELYSRCFNAWTCWGSNCDCIGWEQWGNSDNEDYDEFLVCNPKQEKCCSMLEEWKKRNNHNI